MPRNPDSNQAGFTLLEALVSLTVILPFAAVLGPLLFHARRITVNADGRIAAQILLRALLQEPVSRTKLTELQREGETEGLQWRITAEPAAIATSFPPHATQSQGQKASEPPTQWRAYRVIASVSWAPGQSISTETVRLGKTE